MTTTKYYIEYPIPIRCGLKCAYCFHSEKWELEAQDRAEEKYLEKCPFTPQQFMAWRDKFIPSDDYLYELHGGEMSCCADEVFEIIDTLDKGKFQLQTNGLGDETFYRELIKRKNKIGRIGFTFHRTACKWTPWLLYVFDKNVGVVQGSGIKVYVKELLIPERKNEILESKKFWESKGVEFRIQDFRGYRGREPFQYSEEDTALIYPEYCHGGATCQCREGRKQILIRGYDIFAGDVIACWNDPSVIGNINEMWYNGGYTVLRTANGNDVEGVPKIYRGTYPKDIWTKENEEKFGNLNKQQLKQRSGNMSIKAVDFARQQVEVLKNQIEKEKQRQMVLLQEAERAGDHIRQLSGAIIAYEEVVKIGDAENEKLKAMYENVRDATESLEKEADRVVAVKSATKEVVKKVVPKKKK